MLCDSKLVRKGESTIVRDSSVSCVFDEIAFIFSDLSNCEHRIPNTPDSQTSLGLAMAKSEHNRKLHPSPHKNRSSHAPNPTTLQITG